MLSSILQYNIILNLSKKPIFCIFILANILTNIKANILICILTNI